MHTLVVGATGYLGRHLVREIHARGHTVRAVARDRRPAEEPGKWGAPSLRGLVDEWVIGDVRDSGLTVDVAAGADAVVSALGVTRQKADPWEIDYQANLEVLASAERHRAKAFCYVHALGADRCPAQLTQAKSAFARTLGESSLPSQLISPAAYFSDMMQVFHMAQRGRVYLLSRTAEVNPIHGADLAAVCIDRLEGGASGAWEIGGPGVMTWEQAAEQAFAALDAPARTTRVPPAVVESAARVVMLWNRRAADLLRFVSWGMANSSVGEATGTHHLGTFYADQRKSLT